MRSRKLTVQNNAICRHHALVNLSYHICTVSLLNMDLRERSYDHATLPVQLICFEPCPLENSLALKEL